ncbi:MAG: hypothetical protein PHE08_09150 [Bacteroidales bacterium]|nr:hypothetical protein [Bacteroidales bacterium]
MKIQRISPLNSKHYFFGFHDISPWNKDSSKHICLEIDDISTPPNPNKPCNVGYLTDNNEFIFLSKTYSYNYPQGARQQFIPDTEMVIVNDRNKNNKAISKIINSDTGQVEQSLNFPTHCVTSKGIAFGLDYARLHRVGGYGYAGLNDMFYDQHYPKESGIVMHNIYTGENNLLVSLDIIANYNMKPDSGKHHFITHAVLSPNSKRIAFLHRFKLNDGGETTRLMTIGTDGKDLRLLLSGFLSHFDWADDNSILIWGRTGTLTENIRNSYIFKVLPPSLLKLAKTTIKSLIKNNTSSSTQNFSWKKINDIESDLYQDIAVNKIKEDGHPMFCPINRNWMICDNYPDSQGYRTLFLYDIMNNNRIDLEHFKMIDDKPNTQQSKFFLSDVDSNILKTVGIDNLAFTRSGYHCDLHPRWSSDGSRVSFDSIHEGARHIYAIKNLKQIK